MSAVVSLSLFLSSSACGVLDVFNFSCLLICVWCPLSLVFSKFLVIPMYVLSQSVHGMLYMTLERCVFVIGSLTCLSKFCVVLVVRYASFTWGKSFFRLWAMVVDSCGMYGTDLYKTGGGGVDESASVAFCGLELGLFASVSGGEFLDSGRVGMFGEVPGNCCCWLDCGWLFDGDGVVVVFVVFSLIVVFCRFVGWMRLIIRLIRDDG